MTSRMKLKATVVDRVTSSRLPSVPNDQLWVASLLRMPGSQLNTLGSRNTAMMVTSRNKAFRSPLI